MLKHVSSVYIHFFFNQLKNLYHKIIIFCLDVNYPSSELFSKYCHPKMTTSAYYISLESHRVYFTITSRNTTEYNLYLNYYNPIISQSLRFFYPAFDITVCLNYKHSIRFLSFKLSPTQNTFQKICFPHRQQR